MARPSTLMASRLVACALLAALLAPPAPAHAQSLSDIFRGGGAKLKRGDWQGSYAKQAEQRIEDNNAVAPPEQAQAQNQAQAPTAAPGAPRGQVRIQGRDAPKPNTPAIPPPAGLSVDTREQMREFVQNISTYARRLKRNFVVVTEGGLELLIKRDLLDETRFTQARTYMHAIDGVLVDALYFDKKVFGEPTSEVKRTTKLKLTKIAQENGLAVMVLDYTADRNAIEQSYVRNRQNGYISYAAPAPIERLNRLAAYPPAPVEENPNSILSLREVRNYAYIGDSAPFGRMDEFALAMHKTNYDLLITNVFHGREVLNRRAVDTLKFKQIGGRRLVFATIDIGSAASYRYYWKPNWREGSPGFISAPFRDDTDRFYVQFWRPEWQRVIAGDNQSYIYGIIGQGFDGVVLRGMEETYRFFEGADEAQQEEEERQLRMRLQPQSKATPAPGAPSAPGAPAAPATGAPATAAAPAVAEPAPPAAPATPGAPTPLTPRTPAQQ